MILTMDGGTIEAVLMVVNDVGDSVCLTVELAHLYTFFLHLILLLLILYISLTHTKYPSLLHHDILNSISPSQVTGTNPQFKPPCFR